MALGAQLQKPLVTLGKSLVNPKVNSKMPQKWPRFESCSCVPTWQTHANDLLGAAGVGWQVGIKSVSL